MGPISLIAQLGLAGMVWPACLSGGEWHTTSTLLRLSASALITYQARVGVLLATLAEENRETSLFQVAQRLRITVSSTVRQQHEHATESDAVPSACACEGAEQRRTAL